MAKKEPATKEQLDEFARDMSERFAFLTLQISLLYSKLRIDTETTDLENPFFTFRLKRKK
jgi:hypothetical protein